MSDTSLMSLARNNAAADPRRLEAHTAKPSFPHFELFPALTEAAPDPLAGYERYLARCREHREMLPRVTLTVAHALSLINACSFHEEARRVAVPKNKAAAVQNVRQSFDGITVTFEDRATVKLSAVSPDKASPGLMLAREIVIPDSGSSISFSTKDYADATIRQYRHIAGVAEEDPVTVEIPKLQRLALQAALVIRESVAASVGMDLPKVIDADKEQMFIPKHNKLPLFSTHVGFVDGIVAKMEFSRLDAGGQKWALFDSALLNLRGQPMDAWNHRSARELAQAGKFAMEVRYPDGSFPEG